MPTAYSAAGSATDLRPTLSRQQRPMVELPLVAVSARRNVG